MTSIRDARLRFFCLALLIAAAAGAFQEQAAQGSQTLVVTSSLDDGPGTLRQAVRDAAAGDTITFAESLRGLMIFVTSEEIALTRDVNVVGPGAHVLTIHSQGLTRTFSIAPGASVSISGVTVVGGRGTDGKGGAIHNEGTLSLVDAAIRNSSVIGGAGGKNAPGSTWGGSGGGGGGGGGAIYNAGTLTIERSTLSGNFAAGGNGGAAPATAPAFGGGGAAFGGAIANDGGTVIIRNSTLSGNTAQGGYPVMTG